jgi:hypothetical protein
MEKFELGQEVDVLDTEYIWCRGTIREVVNRKKRSQVLVHYEGWNKVYDEYITQNSYRLAPLGLFTNRKGKCNKATERILPRYSMLLEIQTND